MEDKTPDVQIRLYAFWLDDVSYSTRPDFDPDNPDTRFYSNGVWAGGITKDGTFVQQFNYPCYSCFLNNRFTVVCYDNNQNTRDQKVVNLNVSPETKVPEFPTVAVPVAAILGLLIYLEGKKNDLSHYHLPFLFSFNGV